MINPDVRHIIEPELAEGERIVWREVVPEDWRMSQIKSKIRSDRLNSIFFIIFNGFFGFIIYNGLSDYAARETLVKGVIHYSFSIVFLILGLFALMSFVKSYYDPSSYYKAYEIHSYVLTNQRFIEFNRSGQIQKQQKNYGLNNVEAYKNWFFPNKWKTVSLLLSPIGDGDSRVAELKFLPDLDSTQKKIKAATNLLGKSHE